MIFGRLLHTLPLLACAMSAYALDGRITAEDGAPVEGAFVAALTGAWSGAGDTASGADGAFHIAPTAAYLLVQPRMPASGDVLVSALMPRLYKLPESPGALDLQIPAAGALVLEAYDAEGRLMRWGDFEQLGKYAGQFMYAVNLDDESIPESCWPVFGSLAGAGGGPRETGLPGLYVAPGTPCAVRVLFWPVQGYGKLMLRADNAGAGYQLDKAGAARVLLLNLELARTAVADLVKRRDRYAPDANTAIADLEARLAAAEQTPVRASAAEVADAVLAEALRLRDTCELEAARAAIPRVRQGRLLIDVRDAAGAPVSGCRVEVRQQRRSFLFGVFEGSPYNAKAFELARDAGFEYATVLPAWNWTENPKLNKGRIDKTLGISALRKLGYRVKAHGVLWMQSYGILPDRALAMAPDALAKAALEHQRAVLDVFAGDIDIWEAMNEPANTNVPGLPRAEMMRLMDTAARNIIAAGAPSLVNSPHEFSYGSKYLLYGTDNRPLDDYPMTFSAFLRDADAAGALGGVSVLGLQMYPGFHLNEGWGNLQGPAFTPAHLRDTVDRYAGFGRSIHITEFSFPSSYGADWFSGYWREPWNETTQADYAEAAYTIAFAHPRVSSITWWDILDDKPAVISGGLVRADGTPKPAFERLKSLLAQWRTDAEAETDTSGRVALSAFGGTYEITVTPPGGKAVTQEATVIERRNNTIEIKLKAGK